LRIIGGTLFRSPTHTDEIPLRDSGKKRILVVNAIQDGGLAKISKEIFFGLSQQFDVFYAELGDFEIRTKFQGQIVFSAKGNFLLDGSQRNINFDKEFLNLINTVDPDIIHLEHLNKISHSSIQQLETSGIFISHTLHDYFDLCPSHNLLDENLSFCGGICTKGRGWCDMSLITPGDIKMIKNDFVHEWRKLNSSLLENVNVIFSPSKYSAELFLKTYPNLRGRVKIIPHSVRQSLQPQKVSRTPKFENILFLGNYLPAKGSNKLRALARAGAKRNLTFYHLGMAPWQLRKWAKLLGPYEGADLPKILSELNPDCVVVASIWAETFGLVVDEAAAMGVPIISWALGDISERVAKERIGLVLDPNATPDAVLFEIEKFLLDTTAVSEVSTGLRVFQEGLETRHTTMINSYKVVFENASI
jgi:glycosyltransferase involved in cell wall biosynthesis